MATTKTVKNPAALFALLIVGAELLEGLEIKKIKSGFGHEGETCLTGELYYRGLKTAIVREDTHGGPMDVEVLNEDAYTVFNDWRKKKNFETPKSYEEGTMPVSEDYYLAQLFTTFDLLQKAKRARTKTVLFTVSNNELASINIPFTPDIVDEIREHIKPETLILAEYLA